MICPTCNASNRDDAKFCKSCGQPLSLQPAPASRTDSGDDVSSTSVAVQEEASPSTVQQMTEEQKPEHLHVEESTSIDQEPTLILTPEKMIAYQSKLWQKQLEHNESFANDSLEVGTPQDQLAAQHENTAGPSAILATGGTEQAQTVDSTPDVAEMPTVDIAGMPTVDIQTTAGAEEIPPPPPQTDVVATSEQSTSPDESAVDASHEGQKEQIIHDTEVTSATSEEEKSEAMQEPSDQQESAASTNSFPILSVGDQVLERYEITQVLSEDAQEHIYQVIDHQGYQHCWNCGSDQNAQGDEFCINCGASMLDVPYTMREYSTEQASEESNGHVEDAHVLQGTIVNTFVDHGHTYVVEQQQVEQNPFPNGVQLLAAANSDAGDVRRSEPNEDSTLLLLLQRVHESVSTPSGVFIVADGLGGHDNGQVASRMTINIIAERLLRELLSEPLISEKNGEPPKKFDEDAMVTLFHDAVEDANTALCQKNQLDKTDMGSTITGFMVVGEHAFILNVGDSRTYMLRGKQLYQLTTDHSLVGQLVAGGLIEPDDVYTHPQRSQIYRSLGDKPNVQIDIFKQELLPGDILLSCSDGLWEMVRNPQIESILDNAPEPETACAQFIETANANGGEDNVSAVIVFVR
ncbi:MAG TPA: protein phosphatase 2C domain-containing protein [Ktedonobacteraceae bacterium]|nr:protein phosphatase 2C domain-containing protein [Ktedonobacteraceae bacterium]